LLGFTGNSDKVPQKRVPYSIPGYGASYALLSKAESVDTAAIFVHGFSGKPTSTWINFQCLADEYSAKYPWWTTLDMYFYAYESLHTPIRFNSKRLAEFTESVWQRGLSSAQPANVRYDHLILTGHSEGGVIIRRLVLDKYEAICAQVEAKDPAADRSAKNDAIRARLKSDFVLGSSLCLFAPACMGTNLSSWIGFLSSFSHFVAAFTASSLVRNELLSGSPVLEALRTGTEQAHAEFPDVSALWTRPLFGVGDQIVFSESYKGEELLWDPGYDHFTVCKPTYTHQRPLEFVRK
jgi:hypothetical protein